MSSRAARVGAGGGYRPDSLKNRPPGAFLGRVLPALIRGGIMWAMLVVFFVFLALGELVGWRVMTIIMASIIWGALLTHWFCEWWQDSRWKKPG